MSNAGDDMPAKPFHFQAFNGLVDGGWLATLRPIEVDVYLVYLRHADAGGTAYPGAARLARGVGHAHPNHVRDARRSLVDRGLLTLVRPGGGRESAVYRVNVPPPSPELGEGPNRGRHPTPIPGRHPPRNSGRHPTPNRDTEGLIEGNSKNPTNTPRVRGGVSAGAESVYQAYPRKVAKGAALKAIAKALDTLAKRADVTDPTAWLLARVRAFADSPAGKAGQYTPHPATWFNRGSYDDDPEEWQGRGDKPQRSGEYAEDAFWSDFKSPTAEQRALINSPDAPVHLPAETVRQMFNFPPESRRWLGDTTPTDNP